MLKEQQNNYTNPDSFLFISDYSWDTHVPWGFSKKINANFTLIEKWNTMKSDLYAFLYNNMYFLLSFLSRTLSTYVAMEQPAPLHDAFL